MPARCGCSANAGAPAATVRCASGDEDKVSEHLRTAFPLLAEKDAEGKYLVQRSTQAVSAALGGDYLKESGIALVLGLFGILVYITLRFEFSFALGGFVALLHDVLLSAGLVILFGGELSLIHVGALLTIAGYSINAITGGLSPITSSTPPSGNNPGPLATDPSGSFLYTANGGPDVSAYRINAATGALTEVAGSPFAVGGNPSPMTFRPDGAFVYAPYYVSSLAAFAVDSASGALTPVAGSPYAVGTQPARAI